MAKYGLAGLYDKSAQTRQDKLNEALGDNMKRRKFGRKKKGKVNPLDKKVKPLKGVND